jgi:hypothetical protein
MADFDIPERISQKEALVRAVEADVLDAAPWCILADYLLEINEERGYEVIIRIILPGLAEIHRRAATWNWIVRTSYQNSIMFQEWVKLILIDVRMGQYWTDYHLRDNE